MRRSPCALAALAAILPLFCSAPLPGQAAPASGARLVLAAARTPAGPPVSVRAVAGAVQAHPAGATGAEELVAQVVDAWDEPLPGQEVQWTVLSGGAALTDSTSLTDESGRARNRLAAGPITREQLVVATVRGVADTARFRIGVVAERGYTTFANAIFDSTGSVRVFHGVNRPSLEWRPDGEHIGAADFRLMREVWKADLVRIPVNQDFWLEGAALHHPDYRANVDRAVQQALAAGLHVLVDLHWSDKGDLQIKRAAQQRMPDAKSLAFWKEVAALYRNESHVFFDLYNEPHDVSWAVWRDGGVAPFVVMPDGKSDSAYATVGMQQLYDAVRSTGAENLVVVGGLDWGYDLSGVPAHRLTGHNIVYSTHPYIWKKEWQSRAFFLTATDPVLMGEFGSGDCSTKPYEDAIALADRHRTSWLAWAWWSGTPDQVCKFPTILASWDGTPSATGAIVKAALARYLPSGLLPSAVAVAQGGRP